MAETPAEVIEEFERYVGRTIVALAANIQNELVRTTPVRDGWAKANWVPAVGRAIIANTENLSEEDRLAALAQAQHIQNLGVQQLQTYRFGDGTVFISNGVPYITRLNAGSSIQAPAQFVQAAIEKAIRTTLPPTV